jgi:hypothetical protein
MTVLFTPEPGVGLYDISATTLPMLHDPNENPVNVM